MIVFVGFVVVGNLFGIGIFGSAVSVDCVGLTIYLSVVDKYGNVVVYMFMIE